MINKYTPKLQKFFYKIKDLLSGKYVCREEFECELSAFYRKLDEKWNGEHNKVFSSLINENTNLKNQLNEFGDKLALSSSQIDQHNSTILCLQKRIDEQFQRIEARQEFFQDLLRQLSLTARPNSDELERSLRRTLIEALLSEFVDNFDPYCGATIEAIQKEIESALAYYRQRLDLRVDQLMSQLPMEKLRKLSDQLADADSRQLLSILIIYRLLGITKVRLRSAEDAERDREFYSKLQDLVDATIPAYRSGTFQVPCYDLGQIGLGFRCHTIPFAINSEFRNKQYANAHVHVCPDDWVLDCGACWGDTSLWFAELAGPSGRVFSFEFIPSNLDIFHSNLRLNPELSKRIELIGQPVGESSGKIVQCFDNGAGSSFSFGEETNQNEPHVQAVTISIDDWIVKREPNRVNFIKMDIEGAELDALRGAVETLKRFRPQLAIALYHRPNDIYELPDFLASLNLGYRFYLKHPTAAGFETVLLARVD